MSAAPEKFDTSTTKLFRLFVAALELISLCPSAQMISLFLLLWRLKAEKWPLTTNPTFTLLNWNTALFSPTKTIPSAAPASRQVPGSDASCMRSGSPTVGGRSCTHTPMSWPVSARHRWKVLLGSSWSWPLLNSPEGRRPTPWRWCTVQPPTSPTSWTTLPSTTPTRRSKWRYWLRKTSKQQLSPTFTLR